MVTNLEVELENQKYWEKAADNSESLIRKTLILKYSIDEKYIKSRYEIFQTYSLN